MQSLATYQLQLSKSVYKIFIQELERIASFSLSKENLHCIYNGALFKWAGFISMDK